MVHKYGKLLNPFNLGFYLSIDEDKIANSSNRNFIYRLKYLIIYVFSN